MKKEAFDCAQKMSDALRVCLDTFYAGCPDMKNDISEDDMEVLHGLLGDAIATWLEGHREPTAQKPRSFTEDEWLEVKALIELGNKWHKNHEEENIFELKHPLNGILRASLGTCHAHFSEMSRSGRQYVIFHDHDEYETPDELSGACPVLC